MASKMDSSESKVSSNKSCKNNYWMTHMGSKTRSTSPIHEEEGSRSVVASFISLYATSTTDNGIAIQMCE
jgi:hypothetical protein